MNREKGQESGKYERCKRQIIYIFLKQAIVRVKKELNINYM